MNDEDFAMRKRGFTLIEMLIVVTVVAILAALLMPQLRKGLDAARSAACANNQKQLFMSFNMFAGDNRGCYPPGNTKYTRAKSDKKKVDWPYFSSAGSENTWDGRWINCLGPYFGKDDWVYKKSGWGIDVGGTPANCPVAAAPANTDALNYGLNVNLGRHAYLSNNYNACNSVMTKVSRIPNPGISVMLVDTRKYATVGPGKPTLEDYATMRQALEEDSGAQQYKDKSGWRGPQAWRHMEGCNLLFADGKVKWVDWAAMSTRLTDHNDKERGGWRLP